MREGADRVLGVFPAYKADSSLSLRMTEFAQNDGLWASGWWE